MVERCWHRSFTHMPRGQSLALKWKYHYWASIAKKKKVIIQFANMQCIVIWTHPREPCMLPYKRGSYSIKHETSSNKGRNMLRMKNLPKAPLDWIVEVELQTWFLFHKFCIELRLNDRSLCLLCYIETELCLIPRAINLKLVFLHLYKPIRTDNCDEDQQTKEEDK